MSYWDLWPLIAQGIFANVSTVWDITEISSETLQENNEIAMHFFFPGEKARDSPIDCHAV